jgi:hypothetical protein
VGKKAREERRRQRRLAVIQGGKLDEERHDDLPGREQIDAALDQVARRLKATLDSRTKPGVVAEELLDIFRGEVATFDLMAVLYHRSPARAREIVDEAMVRAPRSETALGLGVALAEIDDDAPGAIGLLQEVGPSSHPRLRAALGRALNVEGRLREAAEVLEPLCEERPELSEAEEERAFAVIAACTRVETDDGSWACPCGSGRTYALCCKRGEQEIVDRFLDRGGFDRFRERLTGYSGRPEFQAMRERAWQEWFGSGRPPDDQTPPIGELAGMIERAWLVLSTAGTQSGRDTMLDRFASDPATSPKDRRRARAWAELARFGLWHCTGEAEPPGVHLEDLLTGTSHYVAFAEDQMAAAEAGAVLLGFVVPFDGVWRTGSTLYPMTVDEADRLRDELLERMAEIEAGGAMGARELGRRLEGFRSSLEPGTPPEDVPADVSLLLSLGAAAAAPSLLELLRELRGRSIVLTNSSGELVEMISARIRVRDLDRVRERLLATGDVRIEEDDPRGLVWEGDEISAASLAEMDEHLRAQGLDPAPDDGPQRWVFGHARVERDVLVVEVNSRARLDRFLGMLEDAGADPRVESAESQPAPQPPAVQRAIAWLHPTEPLPRVTVPAGDELRRHAEASTVLVRIRCLLELLGEKGRKLTPNGHLRLADARELAGAIGVEFDERIGDRVFRARSSADVRPVDETFAWARAAGLVRVVHGWARPTKRAAGFGDEALDAWWHLFESFVRKGQSTWRRRAERGWWEDQMDDLVPRYLEEILRAGGDPVPRSELAERTCDVLSTRYRLDAQTREGLLNWIPADIAYGVMQPLAELGTLELVEEPVMLGDRPTSMTSVEGARSTVIGRWAIHRLLSGSR